MIKNKTPKNITASPSDILSSRYPSNSSPDLRDNLFPRSSPPSLEPINNTTPDINVKSSSDGTPPPPELEPEIIITESNISKDDTESSHKELKHTCTNMEDYLAFSDKHSGRIFSWNSEETSSSHNETQQYNVIYETITESTTATSTDNNSNEDTSPETDMDYDSDASIDVGDSYAPDPGLAETTFDNEPSNEDIEFYDEEEEEDDEDEEEENGKDSASSSSKRFSGSQNLSPADYSMGAVITSSPPEIEALDDSTSELWKMKADDERISESEEPKRRYVIVETKQGRIVNNSERKELAIFQRAEELESVEAERKVMTARNESVPEQSDNSEVQPFQLKDVSQEEFSNHASQLRIKFKEDLMKPKSVKSRGVYRELGMRNNSEHSEDLGEFSPDASVICKESGGTCTIKSPVVILKGSSSPGMHPGDSEVSDQDVVFSLSDTALRCRILVVLWALLGENRLRQVGFPQEPVHKILWRTVDVCCSVAGAKSAAAVPLPSDHDCGRDMVCFRDHAHRFLEVCAPTREHWKRFGWASLTVDAVVRKIYVGEILPALQFVQKPDFPQKVRQAMDVLSTLERASDQHKVSRARFILPKTPLPPEPGTSSSSVRTSSSVADPEPTKKKRGRPAKIANKTDIGRVERVMLWRFLLNLLEDPRNAPCIHWVKREEGIFRILNTDWLARLWGRRHGNPRMTYEKMARAMRTYYRSKVLQPVPRSPNLPRKLVYKFNPAVIQKVAAAKLAAMATQSGSSNSKIPAQHREISS
ncbi:uncharacterized protein [Anabrus simplex]|uniref:uncharacterized protein n=1 Tax=Anabrus simplex TaxID=316456 RepID=UPI0035A38A37